MKHFTIATIASLILFITLAGESFAQSSKELNFSGTHYYGHTPKVYKLDEDQMIIQFETLGVRVNDSGEGPFHEASVQIVGVLYRGKDGTRLRGFETWTDKDGDKLVWEIMEKKPADSPPGTSPGTAKVFSGTGKYVGMQGSMDWLLRYPKPFPEGTGRGICREEVELVPSN
ncbi:MAG: hypothetical protein PVG62_12205 [Desulfobacterales bacterium]|jgi:hypothetical protein